MERLLEGTLHPQGGQHSASVNSSVRARPYKTICVDSVTHRNKNCEKKPEALPVVTMRCAQLSENDIPDPVLDLVQASSSCGMLLK